MKAAVFAYHEIGYVCLEEVLASGMEVACLFTHKDDPGEEIWFRRPVELALSGSSLCMIPRRYVTANGRIFSGASLPISSSLSITGI